MPSTRLSTDRVLHYLALMLPLLLVTGQRMFLVGMLVQAHLTGWVTSLNVVFLIATIVTLLAGFSAGLDAVYTLVGAQTAAALLHWGLVHIAVAKRYRNPERLEHEDVTWLELARFFLPVTATGFMFAISRPVLYAFVSRAPEGLASIAAMRIAFDLSSIFQQARQPVPSFLRHLWPVRSSGQAPLHGAGERRHHRRDAVDRTHPGFRLAARHRTRHRRHHS